MPHQIALARTAGFDDYWVKPLDVPTLADRVLRYAPVRSSRTADSPAATASVHTAALVELEVRLDAHDARIGHRRVRGQHVGRAPLQHATLVEIALVGDLAGVGIGAAP